MRRLTSPASPTLPTPRIALVSAGLALAAVALCAGSPRAAGRPAAIGSGGLAAVVTAPPLDRPDPELRQRVLAAISHHEATRRALEAPGPAEQPFLYHFFPQAGVQGQDLFLLNFTDLDPAPNAFHDWDCGGASYDGHQGHDSVIRSFREQAIGVPVFAARAGTVVAVHDGEPDMNTELDPSRFSNYVILDHGGGYYAVYVHLRRGSPSVAVGQRVSEGAQIGLTGSSGYSSWPHLHLESWRNLQWFEPSSGVCRPGASFWADQPEELRDLYVAGVALTDGMITERDYRSLALDEMPRTAIFPTGQRTVGVRLDVRNMPGGSTYRVRVVRPDGAVAVDRTGPWGTAVLYRLSWGILWFAADLDLPGTWRFQLDVNGDPAVDVPFTVVGDPAEARNRPPYPVGARLSTLGAALVCQARTSLLERDPDYDVVSYRYLWRVNRRVVRDVTSAALSDLLPTDGIRRRDRVTCSITPSDGFSRGRSAQATLAAR